MKIDANITRNDYAAFNKYYMRKKSMWRFFPHILLIFVIAYVFIKTYSTSSILISIFNSICFGLVFLIIYYLLQTAQILLIRHIPSKGGGLLGFHKFVISEKGIEEYTDNSSSTYKWPAVKSFDITKNHLFLFVDNHMAHIFPKREFNSEDQIKDFISLVNKYLNGSNSSTAN